MRRIAAVAVVLAVVACSHPQAAPPATPEPEPAVVAPPIAAAGVVGSYHLQVEIQSGNRPQPKGRTAPQASLTLSPGEAVEKAGDATGSQHAATITMPGYTRPPRRTRGRNNTSASGQAASWWALGNDSVAVEFAQGTRSHIQLRGASHSGSIRGDIWFVSADGASFQLGSFTATKTTSR